MIYIKANKKPDYDTGYLYTIEIATESAQHYSDILKMITEYKKEIVKRIKGEKNEQ